MFPPTPLVTEFMPLPPLPLQAGLPLYLDHPRVSRNSVSMSLDQRCLLPRPCPQALFLLCPGLLGPERGLAECGPAVWLPTLSDSGSGSTRCGLGPVCSARFPDEGGVRPPKTGRVPAGGLGSRKPPLTNSTHVLVRFYLKNKKTNKYIYIHTHRHLELRVVQHLCIQYLYRETHIYTHI